MEDRYKKWKSGRIIGGIGMKQKKIPQRKCIACNERSDKKALIRIVRNKDGEIFFDPTLKANGRGAYICKEMACLEKAIKTKALNRAFKTEISQEVYEKLKLELEKLESK